MANRKRWLIALVAGLTVLAAAWAVSTARAAQAVRGWPMRKEGGQLVLETPHYHMTTDFGPEAAQMVASHQEALYAELYRRMKDIKPSRDTQRFELLVLTTQEAYMRRLGGSVAGSQGVFMPAKNLLAAWGPEDQLDRVLETLRHEGTHQFIDRFIGHACPVWLNEGMAVFYQHGRFVGGRMEVGDVPAGQLNVIKRALAEGRTIPLDAMLGMSDREWLSNVNTGSPSAHLQYCQAWSMVHFLAYGGSGKYRAAFQQYMYHVSRGSRSWDAWTKTFGGDTIGFEKHWREYVQDLKPSSDTACRLNLYVLGMLLGRAAKNADLCKDIETFRQAVVEGKFGTWSITTTDGVTLQSSDKKAMADLFRCPADKKSGDTPSYELVAQGAGGIPVLRCRLHAGVVLETVYEKDGKGNVTDVSVVARPAASVPAKAVPKPR